MKFSTQAGIILAVFVVAVAGNDESRLLRDLFSRRDAADTVSRPVRRSGEKAVVTFNLQSVSVIDVFQDASRAVIAGWYNMKWTDSRLSWNASDYGGLTMVSIPVSMIWLPDVTPYVGIDRFKIRQDISQRALLSREGLVSYGLPVEMAADCSSSGSSGQLSCFTRLGSWTYTANQIDLVLPEGHGSSQRLGSSVAGLRVISSSVRRSVNTYSCCPDPYVELNYRFHLAVSSTR